MDQREIERMDRALERAYAEGYAQGRVDGAAEAYERGEAAGRDDTADCHVCQEWLERLLGTPACQRGV